MPTFILRGEPFEYAATRPTVGPQGTHSWEYGRWPRVEAAVPLTASGSVSVYADAMRWAGDQILVRWQDDDGHYHDAWIPKGKVRKLTPSEWDIIEYDACPPGLRPIRWANRLPGFLPE